MILIRIFVPTPSCQKDKAVRKSILIPIMLLAVALWTTTAGGGEYDKSVHIKKLLDTTSTNLGQKITYPRSGQAHIQSLLVDLKPGAETGLHKHPILTYGYILEGTIEIQYEGGRKRVYKKGEAFIEAVNTLHNGKSIGKSTAKILVVFISDRNQKTVERAK
jgi:quercetin dioxygenase-like cupin family protein